MAAFDHAQTDAAGKLCLIEAVVHRDDCSRELLEWWVIKFFSNVYSCCCLRQRCTAPGLAWESCHAVLQRGCRGCLCTSAAASISAAHCRPEALLP